MPKEVKIDRICNSFLSRAHGLMFSRKQNIVIEFGKDRTVSLHMWFVFFPIDVILLDKNKKVIEIKENFKPFTLFTAQNKAPTVVETVAGVVQEKNIKVGDTIAFV